MLHPLVPYRLNLRANEFVLWRSLPNFFIGTNFREYPALVAILILWRFVNLLHTVRFAYFPLSFVQRGGRPRWSRHILQLGPFNFWGHTSDLFERIDAFLIRFCPIVEIDFLVTEVGLLFVVLDRRDRDRALAFLQWTIIKRLFLEDRDALLKDWVLANVFEDCFESECYSLLIQRWDFENYGSPEIFLFLWDCQRCLTYWNSTCFLNLWSHRWDRKSVV